MAQQVQLRRGTTANHSSFTGAAGEITVDTTLNTIRVHDGSTVSGFTLAKTASPSLTGTTSTANLTVNGLVSVSGNTSVTGTYTVTGNTVSGNTAVTGLFSVNGSAYNTFGTLTDGATITPDFSTFTNFTVTLGGNRTLANPTNVTAGMSGVIYVIQDGTGSRTLSYGSNWKFAGNTAPTLTTTANAVDALFYVARSSSSITVNSLLNVG